MADKRKVKRYIKRLECSFTAAGKTHRGFVSDLSDTGLFIRTRRSFREDSEVDVKLYLPDDSEANVKGIVRRVLTTEQGNLAKNGMGIELTTSDDNYVRFLDEIKAGNGKKEPVSEAPPKMPQDAKPEKVIVQCAICGAKNAIPRDKLSMGPKCGGCKTPLEFGEDFHDAAKENAPPEPVLIACPSCGAKNKVPADKLSLGPKCGACKAALVPKEETAPSPPPQEEKNVEFVMIGCPGCGAKNRLPEDKLSLGPKCGACKEPLPIS